MENKVLFLAGPTAVGKTDLAIRLAKSFPLEVISVDSALIYRELNIGSANPTVAEMEAVPHHLIDILSPLENYSVADFIRDCNQKINEIHRRGNIPILVGGTMMYYNALLNGLSELPETDLILREQLGNEFALHGNALMHQRLISFDPISAAKIAINDTQRIQRALEVCILSGKAMSQLQRDNHKPGLIDCNYLPLAIVPNSRNILHERINLRFVKMLKSGFIEEVEQLKLHYPNLTGEHNSMRSVGYRQVWQYLAGELSYNELIEQGQAATRQLAKRQITWLRSLPMNKVDDVELNLTNLETNLFDLIAKFIAK